MLSPSIHAAFEKGRCAFEKHEQVTTVGQSEAPAGPNRGQAAIFRTNVSSFLKDAQLRDEVFGASSLIVVCNDENELHQAAEHLEGQLTATLHVDADDYPLARPLIPILERKVGRILANDWPTGVEVTDAMVHGGPFPATSDSRTTSVGTLAIRRFLRPICYQDIPSDLLPAELQAEGIHSLPHRYNGQARA
jgi:NADP-dependent aldehyde dehydrogenase